MRILYVLLLCTLATALVFGQASAPADKAAADKAAAEKTAADKTAADKAVEDIKTYCSTIDDYKHDADPRLFADASDQVKANWRRIGTERELDSLTEAQFQHSTIARVWSKDDKVVAVETDYTTAIGDWDLTADYCFREDGTLAKLHSEYHDGTEDYISTRDESFDDSGTVIDTKSQIMDANTHKPKKLSKKVAAAEQHAPVFKKTKDLPFHRLLRTQSTAAGGPAHP
jgi:hypothetical protein